MHKRTPLRNFASFSANSHDHYHQGFPSETRLQPSYYQNHDDDNEENNMNRLNFTSLIIPEVEDDFCRTGKNHNHHLINTIHSNYNRANERNVSDKEHLDDSDIDEFSSF